MFGDTGRTFDFNINIECMFICSQKKEIFFYTYIIHFKHDNKEDEKQSLMHRIVSFHKISTSSVFQKRKRDEDVCFSK